MKVFILLLISFIAFVHVQAQDSIRNIKAVRTTLPVKIDGKLNDEAWITAASFTGFVEQRPSFGNKEAEETRTEAWLLYSDEAIYIAGFCHEKSRSFISTELVGRDRIGINDFMGVALDTYLDRINGFGFYVTAFGEQYDAKYALGNEDRSWSTVYETATNITDSGWTFEMRIPYAAIRFSKVDIQNWGINIFRKRTIAGKQYSWSPIDPNKFGLMNQAGTLSGIASIKAPLRLSFSPYFSSYLNHVPSSESKKNITTSVNGGMDVKYGISKGFTLDMTLIPDFGQVQSDNQVLNLTPFEVKFNENRSFFTEGTELFNKGNFFYSRRIGGRPLHISKPYQQSDSTETIINNPSETKLINATKLSGRTAGGLGIGFFNAVTRPQQALIRKNNTGEEYTIETSPLINYNILVLDQTMKNNSSVSLVNTNVMRNGSAYDANVTAVLFDFYDKNIDWNPWGKVANSNITGLEPGKNISGLLYEFNIGRFKGPFNYEIHTKVADEKYQQNDMGYFTNNNYNDYGFNAWYKFNQPKGIYNNIRISLGGNYSQLYKPRLYQSRSLYTRINSQLKNLWEAGVRADLSAEQQDFYEARKQGRMFKRPGSVRSGFYINTNFAKKYAANIDFNYYVKNKFNGRTSELYLSNQYRFNDNLTISLSSFNAHAKNELGFAFMKNDSSYFGLRNRKTIENIFNIKYNFNIKMGLTFRARHYWSKVEYDEFFSLKDDGYVKKLNSVSQNPESNVNYFNIDMVYTWQFALGSFINVGWKDAGFIFNKETKNNYYKNLRNSLQTDQENNFSVKIIYFLDYLSIKKK